MSQLKKKTQPKAVEPKAKYNIGSRVFFIHYAGNKPEILEGKIILINSTKCAEKDGLGKVVGYTTFFDYSLLTKRGEMEIGEFNLLPSFQAVANEFAKGFLFLLK